MKGKKDVRKWFISIALAIVLVLSGMPVMTYAEGEQRQAVQADDLICTEVTAAPEVGLPDNETLFAGYVEGKFYGSGGISAYSVGNKTAGSKLAGDEKIVYDILLPWVKSVASGATTSSAVALGSEFDYEGKTYQPNFFATFMGKGKDFNLDSVIRALLVDCPYEMYWYDKTKGCEMQYGTNTADELIYIALKFTVSEDYRGADKLTVASAYRVNAAYEEAQRVVKAYQSASDYEKLVAYKDYLCQNVDYNSSVSGSDVPYGDPWQLIYAFDGDPNTKVVCEGYAKAFQYLCDQSVFTEDISCYSVTGYLKDSAGVGAHMWNVVTMEDGKNYLLDVTNIDGGYDLFLVGGTLKQETLSGVAGTLEGYDFGFPGNTVGYYYDTENVWGTDVLRLHTERYVPSQTSTFSGVAITPGSGTWTTETAMQTPLFSITASEYEGLDSGTGVYVSTDNGAKWNLVSMTKQGTVYQSDKTLQDVLGNAVGNVDFKVKLTATTHDDWISTQRTAILSPLRLYEKNAALSFVGLSNDRCYYTGVAQTPQGALVVKSGGVTAYSTTSESNDGIVTFSYVDNTDVGTATVTVQGNGSQVVGSVSYHFTIEYYDAKETVSVSDSNWTKNAVVVTAPDGYQISPTIDGTYAESFTVTEQSKASAGTTVTYYLKTKGQGYITDAKVLTVKIDKTAPQFTGKSGIKITNRNAWWQELLSKLTFGTYKPQSVTIRAVDELSGIKEYYYYIDKNPTTAKTAEELEAVSFVQSADGTFGLDTDGTYVIYAYAVDIAGNQSGYISSEGITISSSSGSEVQTSVAQQAMLADVPDSLRSAGYTSVEDIKEALRNSISSTGFQYREGDVAYYEMVLQYSLDGGITWVDATDDDFPQGGMRVRLGYPQGTGKDTHDFVVSHMFAATSARLGTTAGQMEQPDVIKTDDGIEVVLNGFSPICVAWQEIGTTAGDSTDDSIGGSNGGNTTGNGDAAGSGTPTGNGSTTGGTSTGVSNGAGGTKPAQSTNVATTAKTTVKTGDHAQTMWYVALAVGALVLLEGWRRIRKKL